MDFKEIMEAEILAKRKRFEERAGAKKYIRRGEHDGGVTVKDHDEQVGGVAAKNHDEQVEEEPITLKESQRSPIPLKESQQPPTLFKESQQSPTLSKESQQSSNTSPSKLPDEALLVGAMETGRIRPEDVKTDTGTVRSLVSLFLRRLIREQGAVLLQRKTEERESREGKLASSVYQQCQEHIKPLLRHLRKNTLPLDVLQSLAMICGLMQQREYVKANDMYLRLAIGNAPWPIGVTAVGIHERSSQEKIKSNQVARMSII